MKKLWETTAAVLCAALLSACTGIGEYSGVNGDTDTTAAMSGAQDIEETDEPAAMAETQDIEVTDVTAAVTQAQDIEDTDVPAAVSQAQDIEVTDTLLSRVSEHLALFEYNKAVKLMEDNAEECSSPEFDGARAELKKHFAELAKQYYQAAATYTVKMEIQGYDYSTGFEGYDPYTASLDPQTVAGEVLSQTEANAANRVTICCIDDGSFKVTVEFCGMKAVYPADDIVLD